jgi:hypothetical protein
LSLAGSNLSHDYDDRENCVPIDKKNKSLVKKDESQEDSQVDIDFAEDLPGTNINQKKPFSTSTSLSSSLLQEQTVPFDGFGGKNMILNSLKVRGAIAEDTNNITLRDNITLNILTNTSSTIADTRQTEVLMNETMSIETNGLKGYPKHIVPVKLSVNNETSSSLEREWAWCEIRVQDDGFMNRATSSSSSLPSQDSILSTSRSSAPIYLIAIPGRAVVTAIGIAYDLLSQQQKEDKRLSKDTMDLMIILHAISIVESMFPKSMVDRIDTICNKHKGCVPQVVWLLENLGHGLGRSGAFGRLHNLLFDEKNHAMEQEKYIYLNTKASAKRLPSHATQSSLEIWEAMQLGQVSLSAAQYLSDHAVWLMNLFIANLLLLSPSSERRNALHTTVILPHLNVCYQAIHVSDENGENRANQMIGRFVHEMHRLALLTYSP